MDGKCVAGVEKKEKATLGEMLKDTGSFQDAEEVVCAEEIWQRKN